MLSQTPGAFYNLIAEDLAEAERGLACATSSSAARRSSPGCCGRGTRKYPETKLVNMYGITETTVHVTYKELGTRKYLLLLHLLLLRLIL